MKKIELTQGQVALVDDEDYDILMQHKWNANRIRKTDKFYAYTHDKEKYDAGEKSFKIGMHNIIMNRMFIDHIDNDGLNNQKSNLRICTTSQNRINTKKRNNCESIYKGVSKSGKYKWRCCTSYKGKNYYLGTFNTEIEAAEVYNKKAIELYGEFALLNNLTL